MKLLVLFFGLLASPSIALADETVDDTLGTWTCVARTPVLQRAFTGSGNSEADARAVALERCQRHAVFGCYVARCDQNVADVDVD